MTDAQSPRLVLVTGMSGAGRSAALKALEDFGFEAVDNLPLTLLPDLLSPGDGAAVPDKLAVCVDARTRAFSADAFADALAQTKKARAVTVIFLDCDDDELARRYVETRHRHPLAGNLPVADGIKIERGIIMPVRGMADIVIDTSAMTLGDLKAALAGHLTADGGGMSVFVTSFSFKKGIPRNADIVFDVRFLANPHYDEALRPLSGRDAAVQAFIKKDPGFDIFFKGVSNLLGELLPRYAREGKSYLTIALGCTGGRHRSVFAAEQLADALKTMKGDVDNKNTHDVRLAHRDLDDTTRGDKAPGGTKT